MDRAVALYESIRIQESMEGPSPGKLEAHSRNRHDEHRRGDANLEELPVERLFRRLGLPLSTRIDRRDPEIGREGDARPPPARARGRVAERQILKGDVVPTVTEDHRRSPPLLSEVLSGLRGA